MISSQYYNNKEDIMGIFGKKKQQEEKELNVNKYNRNWLNKVANAKGYEISDDDRRVDQILNSLNKRGGHCPCGGMTEIFMCPCQMMREHGNCKCGLYKEGTSIDVDNIKSSSTGKIK